MLNFISLINDGKAGRAYLGLQDRLRGDLDFDDKEFKKRERIISKSPMWSLQYAEVILRRRFKLGERAMAKDAAICWKYSLLIGGRFELGEKTVKRSPFREIYEKYYDVEL